MARWRTCGTHHGTEFWVNTEPCGLICACMTYLMLGYGTYATTFKLISPWLGIFSVFGLFNTLLMNTLVILAVYSHYKCMTTDPGAVPKDAVPLPSDMHEADPEAALVGTTKYRKFCKRCKAFKPTRAHHCSMCGRCVVKMDHHCPWVNNCVGIGNHKLFLLFLFWVNVVCAHALLLIATRYGLCFHERSRERCGTADSNFFIVFLLVEAMLFGIFTLCMMGDQSTTIWTNQTAIDRLKNVKHEGAADYNEVLGSPNSVSFDWQWLIPTPVRFPEYPDQRWQAAFGYCRESFLDAGGASDEFAPLVGGQQHRHEERNSESVGLGSREGGVVGDSVGDSGNKDVIDAVPTLSVLEMQNAKPNRVDVRKRAGPP